MAGKKMDYVTPYPHGSSGVRGVSFDKTMGKWEAKVMSRGKRVRIGRFDSIEDAASAHAAYVGRLECSDSA